MRKLVPLVAIALVVMAGIFVLGPERERRGKARLGRKTAPPEALAAAAAPQVSAAAPGWDVERVWSGFDDWEPAVAADPSSSNVYQMTTRYNGPPACKGCSGPWIIFRSSSDGGATWGPDRYLSTARKGHNDPEIEVAVDGTIYAAWLNEYSPGIKFTKSADRGQTWTAPIAIAGAGAPSWSDKPILAISDDGRYVHIGFNASDSWVVTSQDYGRTFTRPKKISADTRYWFHTGGVVAPNGSVHFAAVDYSQDYTGDANINVQTSTDFGATWTTRRIDTSREAPPCAWSPGCYLGFLGPSAAIAADDAGRLVLSYPVGSVAGGPQRLYARVSTDNGLTWSARVELSNGSATVNNGFPALASGPGVDDFRVAWQDDRNGARTAWNTWYRRSTNGGTTWSAAVRLSDLGTGAPYKSAAGYGFPYGDYFEMAVDGTGRNHVLWGEGTSYDGPGGTWYTRGQ